MLIKVFLKNCFYPRETMENALSSAESLRLVKLALWIVATRAIKRLTSFRKNKSALSVELKLKMKRENLDNVPPDPGDTISQQPDGFLRASP
jgi:hypothetical protein